MTASVDLNTILMAIALGVLAWIARTTHQSAKSIAVVDARMEHGGRKFEQHELEILNLRARVTECEIDLARLKEALKLK